MTCPNCGGKMNEVKAEEHYYGREIVVDQCEKCGGLWFDKGEFYRVKIGEAMNLEKIDVNKLTENSSIKEAMACPKDGRPLKKHSDVYADKSLKGLAIFTCQKCEGFWFNRGEFTKYQGAEAEEKIAENKNNSLVKSIASIESYRKELEKADMLRPVGTNAIINYGKMNNGGADGGWGMSLFLDVASLILNAFLRRR